jgi:hypothetical protein
MCQTFLEDIKSLPRESTATLILREITNNDTLRIEVNDSGTQMEIQGTQSDMPLTTGWVLYAQSNFNKKFSIVLQTIVISPTTIKCKFVVC